MAIASASSVSTSSKSNPRNKWFHCFKIIMESKKLRAKKGKNDPLDLADDENMVFPLHDIDRGRRCRSKRKMFRCGFYRIVKGVFFHTSPAKKTRSKKLLEGEEVSSLSLSMGADSSPSEGSSGHSNSSCRTRITLFTSSPSALSLSHQSSSSTSLSNLSSASQRKPSSSSDLTDLNTITTRSLKRNKSILLKRIGEDQNANNIGRLYILIVICLVGLVFSGKAFAIFCTATCSFFLFQGAGISSTK